MGRAQARPLCFLLQAAGSSTEQPGPEMPPLRTPGCQQTPLHRHSRAQCLPGRLAQRVHAPRQAQSSCWPTGRRVRPGVTAATPLTLAAASHWPAGPSLGHACWHGPGRARHIKGSVWGSNKSVSTQVKD